MEETTSSVEIVQEQELTKPSVPTTIAQLAALENERGVAIIDSRVLIFNTLRTASIQLTMPNDWTLFKNDAGIFGYLGDQGCDRIKKLWGLQIDNLGPMTRIEDTSHPGEFAYSITGDGKSHLTGECVFAMEGIRYSTERYALEKPEGIQRTVAVQKAARANLDGGITRELTGMKSVPAQELISAWKAEKQAWKSLDICNKGRGFGSQAERSGAAVQQTSEIRPEFQPKCETCNQVMKFIPAGTTATGKSYAAFWSCPNREHKGTVKHEQALAEARRLESEAKAGEAHA